MTTSNDLMGMLRASMNAPSRPSPGYVVGELKAPNSERRADALFFPLDHARRGEIHGYEFKISRSDLLTELADPMKADPWLRYCTTWTLFVSDPALVRGLDIPEAWGIVAPPSGNRKRALTVLRPAPKLSPVVATPALMQAIARLYYGADGLTDERVQGLREQLQSAQQREYALINRATDAERRLARLDPSQKPDSNRALVDAVVDRLSNVWLPGYSSKVLEQWGVERLVALLTDIGTLEGLRAELAETTSRDLADLEQVHETRGYRLKAARRQLEKSSGVSVR